MGRLARLNPAAALTCSFEALGLRGAPTLLSYLAKTPLSRRVASVELPAGQRIFFPAYDAYWARHLYAGVPYEPDVEAILRRFSTGRVLVDCGANIGYWSVRAEELGFDRAIAIEANETWIPFLERNHDGPILHRAVHAISGKPMHLAGEGSAAALADTGKPVQSLALKDLNLSQPALIKLDVEGVEVAAIDGAGEMDALFVYEDWPRSGMSVTAYLLDRGYRVFGFDLTPIASLDEAYAFNRRTRQSYGPSNFLASRCGL